MPHEIEESGLLRLIPGAVPAACNKKAPKEVLEFEIDGYFNELGLIRHLSPIRDNGLRAMVARIRDIAAAAA